MSSIVRALIICAMDLTTGWQIEFADLFALPERAVVFITA